MKVQALIAGTVAVLAFAGCGKDTPAGHIADEAGKASQETELRSAKWVSMCDTTNLVLDIAGVKSKNTVYDFTSDVGRTVQYFSSADCNQSNVIAQVTYAGSQTIGTDAAGGTARVLDLNYQAATVTISSADLVSSLNGGVAQIQNCGINDWAAGAGRNVPANVAGGANCLFVSKLPFQSFDIVKTDGQTTFFGDMSTGDGTTQEKRPTALDTAHGYHKL